MKKTLALSLIGLLLCFLLVACGGKAVSGDDLWKQATYTEDTALGSGAKTVDVSVKAGEKSVTFTVSTDRETLADALLEHGLIAGDTSEYGLYVKTVNGIFADYDQGGHYWSFNKNGEMLMTGVDAVILADGDSYEIVYT